MRKQIEILSVEEKKSKKGSTYWTCQCIVRGEDVKVGELMVFNKDLQPTTGNFFADFDVRVDYERRLTAELLALTPISKAPVQPSKPMTGQPS